jgi:hypothetical protein
MGDGVIVLVTGVQVAGKTIFVAVGMGCSWLSSSIMSENFRHENRIMQHNERCVKKFKCLFISKVLHPTVELTRPE